MYKLALHFDTFAALDLEGTWKVVIGLDFEVTTSQP